MKKILMYLVLPIVILFTNIIKVNAIINNDLVTTYNYNAPFVYNNFDTLFFDNTNEGYLTDLSKTIVNQNWSRSWLIGFSKDDLYYFSTSAGSDFALSIATYSNNQAIQVFPTTIGTYYYYQLSDFATYNGFKNAILNNSSSHRHQYSVNNPFYLFSSNNTNFMYYSYNYFDTGVQDYFIPFISNVNIINQCQGSSCSANNVVYNSLSINNISSYVPTYFELFGLQKPSKNLTIYNTRIYSLDNLTLDLSSTWSFTYKLPKSASNVTLTFDLYYKDEYDTGLFYYKEITNEVSINSGTYLTCDNSFCYYSLSSTDIVNNSLDSSTSIYIKAKLSSPVIFNVNNIDYSYTGTSLYFGWYNNLDTNLLSLTLYSNSTNSYLFSTDSVEPISFYYTTYANQENVYGKPQLIKTDTKEVVSFNLTSSKVKTFFGTNANSSDFYYLNYRNINSSRGYALNFSMYPVNLDTYEQTWFTSNVEGVTYDFQYNFFISPNLYWSDSQLATDKKSVSAIFINENGQAEDIVVEHNFSNQLEEYVGLGFSITGLEGLFSDDFYGLSGIITAPFNYIQNLNNYSCNNLNIPFPFTNTNIVIPCLSNYYSSIGSLVNIIHIVMYGIVSWFIGKDLFKTIFNAFKPNKNDIEVVDL